MSAALPQTSFLRRYAVLALKIAVSIVILWLLFRTIDAGELWDTARQASAVWLGVAAAIYSVNLFVSAWRWHRLLDAQHVVVPRRWLFGSFMVASFFNNVLPSNIGGDVARISDTAKPARSKTLAATVVLMDRGLGLMALILVAAVGASTDIALNPAALPIWWAVWLWTAFLGGVAVSAPAVFAHDGFGRLLKPLALLHPEWIGGLIGKLMAVLARFKARPGVLVSCFGAAAFVQATMVVFYFAVAYALHLNVSLLDLSVIVPLSFVVQMLPVSFGGFGVREATFSIYFSRIGQPKEAAIAMSLVAQALIMLFSLSGAAVYVSRGHRRTAEESLG